MTPHTCIRVLALFVAVLATSCSSQRGDKAEESAPVAAAPFMQGLCRVGVYGTSSRFVVITRRNNTFRYSMNDGRLGRIEDTGPIECGNDSIRLQQTTILPRQTLAVTNTRFESDGVTLAGQLIEPVDASPASTLIVLAHGSEERGWIEDSRYPYHFVARGVSVFVYDKRGTGKSGGAYSQNFPELADDLVAAAAEAKRIAEARYSRFGLFGFSQGGWIAPLAAARSDADFIGISYGLVVDILEEDAAQVELELIEAGYDKAILSKANQITDITARLAVSHYQDGLDDLAAVQSLYGDEPWFSAIRGGFTGVLLGMSPDKLREEGVPMFDRLNIDWSIKPMNVLRTVNVPQLWVLAEADREAPVTKTLSRLQTLRREGKDITIVMYPNTDHGMREFMQSADGTRQYTRITDTYYDLIADWANGRLEQQYGTSVDR
ncbi:MAG: alpha/beta hydrolase [Pseudomonadota bacterium]